MQFISCHNGKLQTLATAGLKTSSAHAFTTGLPALDALAPQNSFARGVIHELLFDPAHAQPNFIAATIARAAATEAPIMGQAGGFSPRSAPTTEPAPIIWSDPRSEIYPPALAALGLDLNRV